MDHREVPDFGGQERTDDMLRAIDAGLVRVDFNSGMVNLSRPMGAPQKAAVVRGMESAAPSFIRIEAMDGKTHQTVYTADVDGRDMQSFRRALNEAEAVMRGDRSPERVDFTTERFGPDEARGMGAVRSDSITNDFWREYSEQMPDVDQRALKLLGNSATRQRIPSETVSQGSPKEYLHRTQNLGRVLDKTAYMPHEVSGFAEPAGIPTVKGMAPGQTLVPGARTRSGPAPTEEQLLRSPAEVNPPERDFNTIPESPKIVNSNDPIRESELTMTPLRTAAASGLISREQAALIDGLISSLPQAVQERFKVMHRDRVQGRNTNAEIVEAYKSLNKATVAQPEAEGRAAVTSTRTPEFKRWFGDWEAAKKLETLTSMTPMNIDTTPLGDHEKTDELRIAAEKYYKDYLQHGVKPVINRFDNREIHFSRAGWRETRNHSADVRVLKIIPSLRNILTESIPLASEIHTPQKQGDNTRAWHYYALPVVLDRVNSYVRTVVREDINGNIYYDNDLTTIDSFSDKMKRGRAEKATRIPNTGPNQRDLIHSIPELLNFVNPSS